MDNESTRLQPQVGAAGKYKILKRIAVGGMAEIYLAEAANIHGFRKKVVIKRMLPQYATEQAYIEMFLDEARLVARLNHPSVVQVFDIGEDSEGVFFTMEYVQGNDLSEILGSCYRAHRQLSFAEVLAIAIPAAEGLHHAHEARDDSGALINLIHRDVSPSNVIVTNAGRVKLLDFGVAKSRSQSRETTGVSLKGKFGYMAPEQCEGLAIDRRCDVYSFGVVLWELFTGKRLHGGGNEPSVLVKIMTQDPPAPSSIRRDIPPTLDAICLKALARNRDNRYSTMQELLVDLDRYMSESGTVISSRTLSAMLEDVFAEERPTMAMAMPTPDDLVATQETPASQLVQPPAAYAPGAGSDGGHGQPGSGAQGQQAGSNGGHGQPGSGGGHQAQAGSNPSAGYPNPEHGLMAATGPLPTVGGMTPGHGYATLRPGTQFDQGSEIVVPMKSRKGVLIAIIGTVVVLGLGLFVISGSEDAPTTEEAGEAVESTVLEDSLEPDEPAVVPPVAEQTPEELAAAKEKAAADKLAEEKAAAADKAAAEKAAAEKAAAEKAAAAAALAEEKAEAARLAQEEKAAAAKLAEEKAAAAMANSAKSTEAKAAAKAAAQAKRAEERAAAKLVKDKAAADRAAARAASRAAAAKKAQERAAERKAAAAERNANKPKDREKKPPKWDPNSPFAPQ